MNEGAVEVTTETTLHVQPRGSVEGVTLCLQGQGEPTGR